MPSTTAHTLHWRVYHSRTQVTTIFRHERDVRVWEASCERLRIPALYMEFEVFAGLAVHVHSLMCVLYHTLIDHLVRSSSFRGRHRPHRLTPIAGQMVLAPSPGRRVSAQCANTKHMSEFSYVTAGRSAMVRGGRGTETQRLRVRQTEHSPTCRCCCVPGKRSRHARCKEVARVSRTP